MALPKYNVTCVFEDGGTAQFQSTAQETVYQAALRSGLKLETDCREGACAVCKAFRSSGDADMGDFSEEALGEKEREEGFVLSCQLRPHSDLVLEFAYPLSLLRKETNIIEANVSAMEIVADNVVHLVIETKQSDALAFLPGQYVNISVPGFVNGRSYSFANPPGEGTRLEFFVRLLDQGEMSSYLRGSAKLGDAVRLEGPFGQFFLRPARAAKIIMIAGGTGLAPMLSMLSKLRNDEEKPSVTLLYGANQPAELFGEELVMSYGDQVDLRQIVVDGDEDWQGPTGFVTDLLVGDVLDNLDQADAYLCGPPPMIDAARAALIELGVPASRIFAEKFLPSS